MSTAFPNLRKRPATAAGGTPPAPKKTKVASAPKEEEHIPPTEEQRWFYEHTQFMEVETVERDLHDPDLDNAIDPVWRATNFTDRKIDYRYIEPSARLASLCWKALEEMEPGLFDMIVNCGRAEDQINLGEMNKNTPSLPHMAYQIPTGDPAEQKRLARAALARLPDIVRFRLKNLSPSVAGETQALNKNQWKPGFKWQHHYEFPSEIRLNAALYAELVACTDAAPAAADPARLLVLQWWLAATLVHETAHALTHRYHTGTKYYNEVFVSPNAAVAPLAKIGFEVERRVFGGLTLLGHALGHETHKYMYTDGEFSKQRGVLVFWTWPYNGVWQHYAVSDLAWRVPLKDVARLFRKSTWAQVNTWDDVLALHPVRERGYCFITGEDFVIRHQRVPPADRVLPGFGVQPSGDIFPLPAEENSDARETASDLETEDSDGEMVDVGDQPRRDLEGLGRLQGTPEQETGPVGDSASSTISSRTSPPDGAS
ncbi:hypothetical protein LTR53_010428 [Teratosphaeriaceae sp. CCFEE 6253]|nr:hypothetical protein LTR53_010428 [Teratosphaeriaceae sp. CCFEE 6253]